MKIDYTQGVGYIQGYRYNDRSSAYRSYIADVCETGESEFGPLPAPALTDVLFALVSDSEVFDYPDFGAWADALGLNPDSREAEKLYNDCLDEAIALQSMIGDEAMDKLHKLYGMEN